MYVLSRSGLMNQPSPIMADPVLSEPSEWMVDPNEPRYCLCNQVCVPVVALSQSQQLLHCCFRFLMEKWLDVTTVR